MAKHSVLMVLIGLAAMLSGCRQDEASASPLVGQPAPTFKLQALDGQVVDLAALRGKPVVLDFWAPWCPPCRELAPSMQRLHEALGDKLVVLGLARDEADTVRQYTKEHGLTMTQVIAPDDVAQAYGVDGIPTTVFIDQKGVVRDVQVGLRDGDAYRPLKAAVDRLL